jgi:hypothetical protein
MRTVIKTGNRSKVKTGNPKTTIVTGLRSRVYGSFTPEPVAVSFRLLEDSDFRLLEDGDFRLLE